MTTLVDIDRLINNERQFTVQQKNTLLKCFAAAFGIDSGLISDVTSPNNTIDVAISQGDAAIDINGNPPGDDSNSLGDRTHRWQGVVMPSDGEVSFHTGNVGPGQASVLHWTDNVGPVFSDAHADVDLTFNVQSLAANRTATWQNSSGTVAWLTDVKDYTDLYAGPTLVTINHTSGGSFNSGIGLPAIIIVTSDNAGTIVGSLQIGSQTPSDLYGGWELVVTFLVAATTITHGANFSSTNGKTLPTSASANQTFRYIWDNSASKWKYYQ